MEILGRWSRHSDEPKARDFLIAARILADGRAYTHRWFELGSGMMRYAGYRWGRARVELDDAGAIRLYAPGLHVHLTDVGLGGCDPTPDDIAEVLTLSTTPA